MFPVDSESAFPKVPRRPPMNFVLRIVASVVLLLLLIVAIAGVSLSVFLKGQGLRERVESTLTNALGRGVTIRRLDLSPWSGGLLAEDMSIAEDVHVGSQPFLKAQRVRMKVEVLPLLLRRQVRLQEFTFEAPEIRFVRAADGGWNFSTLGRKTASDEKKRSENRLPELAISSIRIRNGRITTELHSDAEGSPTQTRVYQQFDLTVRDFSLAKQFSFKGSFQLPGEGSFTTSGTAGPFAARDKKESPFTVHVDAHHLDLNSVGVVTASSGVNGMIDRLALDLTGDGNHLHVTKFRADCSRLTMPVYAAAQKDPLTRKTSAWSTIMKHLAVDQADIRVASLSLARKDAVLMRLSNVHFSGDNIAPGRRSAFTMEAGLPGGGELRTKGDVQFSSSDNENERSPSLILNAALSVTRLNLARSGLLSASSSVSGYADLQSHVHADGKSWSITGTARVAELKLARDGQPSPKPVETRFSIARDGGEGAAPSAVQIKQAVLSLDGALVNVAGNYAFEEPVPTTNLRVRGDNLSIDKIEAFMPVLGLRLPENSRLQGGTLSTDLTVSGPVSDLVVSGPVRMKDTRLTGFDLGAKLSSLSRFTGGQLGSATAHGTAIRTLSMDLRKDHGVIQTSSIAVSIVGLGAATGAGSIGQGGLLNYKLLLNFTELSSKPDGSTGFARSLAGQLPPRWAGKALGVLNWLANGPFKNGVPVLIAGTTQHPTFSPNLGALLPVEQRQQPVRPSPPR